MACAECGRRRPCAHDGETAGGCAEERRQTLAEKKKQEADREQAARLQKETGEEPDQKETERPLSLEESFERLDEILEMLEEDSVPLEESFALYQRGMQLLQSCSQKIDTVEKKILIMNGDGGLDEF